MSANGQVIGLTESNKISSTFAMQTFSIIFGVLVTVILHLRAEAETDTQLVSFIQIDNNDTNALADTELELGLLPEEYSQIVTDLGEKTRIKRKSQKESHGRKKSSKKEHRSEDIEGSGANGGNEEEDAYHVRYETKFGKIVLSLLKTNRG